MVKRARILRRAQEPSAETQEPSAETQENCDSPDAAVSADVIVNVEAPGAAGYVRHSIRTMVALSEVQIAQMTFAEYMYKVSTLLEQVTPYYTIAKAWHVKLNRAQYAEDIARAIAEWCEGCDELMSEMSGVLHCVEESHGDCDWRKNICTLVESMRQREKRLGHVQAKHVRLRILPRRHIVNGH